MSEMTSGFFVIEEQLDKLEFGGESPRTSRARCGGIRYCPDPLGIVTAKQFDKLEFISLFHSISCHFGHTGRGKGLHHQKWLYG